MSEVYGFDLYRMLIVASLHLFAHESFEIRQARTVHVAPSTDVVDEIDWERSAIWRMKEGSNL